MCLGASYEDASRALTPVRRPNPGDGRDRADAPSSGASALSDCRAVSMAPSLPPAPPLSPRASWSCGWGSDRRRAGGGRDEPLDRSQRPCAGVRWRCHAHTAAEPLFPHLTLRYAPTVASARWKNMYSGAAPPAGRCGKHAWVALPVLGTPLTHGVVVCKHSVAAHPYALHVSESKRLIANGVSGSRSSGFTAHEVTATTSVLAICPSAPEPHCDVVTESARRAGSRRPRCRVWLACQAPGARSSTATTGHTRRAR